MPPYDVGRRHPIPLAGRNTCTMRQTVFPMHDPDAPVVLWLRRELRLADNPALAAAIATGRPLLPVFVLDDVSAGQWALGGASRWWLYHTLASLASDLAARGVKLVLRRGRAAAEIARLVEQSGAAEVHAGLAVEPWARRLLRDVARGLAVKLHLHNTTLLFDPGAIRTGAGGPYGVFTPFSRACLSRGDPPAPLPTPVKIRSVDSVLSDSLADWHLLPTRPDWAAGLRATWIPGEAGAHRRLADFIATGLEGYDETRNLPGIDGSSRLSPCLHWGELSPGQVWHASAAAADTQGRFIYRNELLWREFSANLLWHHPTLPEQPLRTEFAAMPWQVDPVGLAAWQRGATGIPIVDAGMRQLWRTGWMHNRVRMVVASFLIKHLLVPWQEGEAWFWDTLVDADLASNSAQWQWVAGCGADAAPFFRVFNPVLQGRKFDADGAYVRAWVPELARLPDRFLHAPWEAPDNVLEYARVQLGRNYPRPIVDLATGRARALAAFQRITRPAA